jgi:excisionase family DNA binding protein
VSRLEEIVAAESDTLQLQELSALLAREGFVSLRSEDGGPAHQLPAFLHRALKVLIDDLSQGKSVFLLRETEELTTQVAANVLNVSRPYFIKLIESGAIPFTKTGSHRRILLRDVRAYKKVRDAERRAVLDQMAKDALEDGSYFGVPLEDGQEDS